MNSKKKLIIKNKIIKMSRKKIKEFLIMDEIIQKELEIKEASIKDDFCNYSYELMRGVGEGDTIARKGASIIHDDMKESFERLNVHLAVIDDAFKYSKIDISDINLMHDHELTALFFVTGFKIKGSVDNESIILVGNKFISTGGYISLETPRIKLDGGYPFSEQLKDEIEKCKNEVEEYMNGKAAPKFEQTELEFEPKENEFSEAVI